MITFKQRGNFKNLERFFSNVRNNNFKTILKAYAELGLEALRSGTPVDTGLTADSWGYIIAPTRSGYSIRWTNSNVVKDVSVALLLQYGHGTQNGAFIEGYDYINPVIKPVFDGMADKLWKEVTK